MVVDPYLSDTAAKAQEWVAIRPGTDGALALGMAHVIIRDDLYDHDFVTAWTSGFDAYATYVADKTPEWAEEITSIPAATIERLARELATTRPALVDSWSGPGQHSNAVQGGRAVRSNVRKVLGEGATAEEIRQVAVLAVTTAGFPTTIAALGWVDEVLAAES